MALQSSGAISLNDVQTEFGGSNPIAISEYYGADSGVPSSGAISLNDFYGASAVLVDETSGTRMNLCLLNSSSQRPSVGAAAINIISGSQIGMSYVSEGGNYTYDFSITQYNQTTRLSGAYTVTANITAGATGGAGPHYVYITRLNSSGVWQANVANVGGFSRSTSTVSHTFSAGQYCGIRFVYTGGGVGGTSGDALLNSLKVE